MASPAVPAVVYGFLGAGNMASAIVRGLIAKRVASPAQCHMSSPSGPRESLRALGIHAHRDNASVVAAADVLLLCVKPHIVPELLAEVGAAVHARHLVVSVAAGVPLAEIGRLLAAAAAAADLAPPAPDALRLARAMPNTPSAIGQGATAFCVAPAAARDAPTVRALFGALGTAEEVKEGHMDAVTGLSGSGPAYVCLFVEALADGGVAAGLPRATAMALAAQLVRGTAALLQESGTHPGALKDAVASPGGTTIAGLHALETGAFRGTVMSAVVAAAKRATELRGPTK